MLSWSTHKRIFLINALPYGIMPACAVFQKSFEKVLLGLKKKTINFSNDVIVTDKTHEEHTENLRALFTRLNEAGFRINLSECKFFQNEFSYLGHNVKDLGKMTLKLGQLYQLLDHKMFMK